MQFRSGRYPAAMKSLEESPLKEQHRNRLLYTLEKAMILDQMGEKKQARRHLIDADKIVDELYTTSISKTAATFVYNDSASEYEGEDYEKVAIHTMLALSFLEDGDLDSARVSAKKINNKLYQINQQYDEKKNAYGADAFALYLSGMIYEAKGDWDSAIIDYKKALKIYSEDYKQSFFVDTPKDLVRSLFALAEKRNRSSLIKELKSNWGGMIPRQAKWSDDYFDKGEVIVFHEVGNISVKRAKEFLFNFGKQVIRFSFPYIERKSFYGQKTGVDAEGRSFEKGDIAQDLDAIAAVTLEDRRGRMLVKNAARLLVKGQLTEEAHKRYGPLGGLAANVFSAVTETADTRGWTLLPRMFYVTRLKLKPGDHTIRIYSNGRLNDTVKLRMKKGQTKFFRVSS